MPEIHPIDRKAWGCFFVIFVLAAFTRLADGGRIEHFLFDQSRLSQMALEVAHGDTWYWAGPNNSAGIPTSPLIL